MPVMVYKAVNEHLNVISALLEALFPALPEDAKAARIAGREAEATYLETPGNSDTAVAHFVRARPPIML